jgi:hypothetical protein
LDETSSADRPEDEEQGRRGNVEETERERGREEERRTANLKGEFVIEASN